MIVIEKLKVLNNVRQKKNNKPFIIPFVPCHLPWTNDYMSNEVICKEALGTLFGLGCHALKTLVQHAKYHTLPIHGSTGRVDPKSAQFQQNVLPSLAHFFETKIVPLAGARSTRYTRDAVTCTTIERCKRYIRIRSRSFQEGSLQRTRLFTWLENCDLREK